jgi:hypothetical protein
MKKVKALLALTAVVALVTVSSVAYAQQSTTLSAGIDNLNTFNADCNNDGVDDGGAATKAFQTTGGQVNPSLALDDSEEMYCQVFADSNSLVGFYIDISGTTGLVDGVNTWTPLDDTTDATVDAGEEEWGFRLTNTTSAAYTDVTGAGNGSFDYSVQDDSGHINDPVTYATDDHTLSTTAETIINESGQVTDGAHFATEISLATSDSSTSGSYTETVVYTQTFN